MLMGSSVLTTSTVSEALSLIGVMLDPQQAKRVLEELAQKVAELDKKQAEVAALQKQAETDRAAADARVAEAETRVSAIAEREKVVTARELQAERVRALVRERLAAAEA
jgi:hypothetical protein